MKNNKNRAFLKWAGGKYTLIESIQKQLAPADMLVEPFVGAASVFLNTQYDKYWLNDINADLIALYQILQTRPDEYIRDAQTYFNGEYNDPDKYYAIRDEFNQSHDSYQRSVLFLYMNRHGYNGLCRYNLSGKFNVPFGRYKAPYFPEKELNLFAEKAERAVFTNLHYRDVFAGLSDNAMVYCDPPYAPLQQISNFTQYAKAGFSIDDQIALAQLAEQTSEQKKVDVLISNHDTQFTKDIYSSADLLKHLKVSRFISQKGNKRQKVGELLALYKAR